MTTPARDLLATWEREQLSGDLAYEAAQLHALLDTFGVPHTDPHGERYPLYGRFAWFVLPAVRSGWTRAETMDDYTETFTRNGCHDAHTMT